MNTIYQVTIYVNEIQIDFGQNASFSRYRTMSDIFDNICLPYNWAPSQLLGALKHSLFIERLPRENMESSPL